MNWSNRTKVDIKKVSTKGPMKDFRTNLSIFFISFSVFPHAGTCPIRPMPKGTNFYLSFYLLWRTRPYGRNPCNCIELFRPAIHRWLASPHRPPPSDAAIPALALALALAGQNEPTHISCNSAMRQSRHWRRRWRVRTGRMRGVARVRKAERTSVREHFRTLAQRSRHPVITRQLP